MRCDYVPLIETYTPTFIEILRENKFKQTMLNEKIAKEYFIDVADDLIETDVKYLMKKVIDSSLNYTGILFPLKIETNSPFLVCKHLLEIWNKIQDAKINKNTFFTKVWLSFVRSQMTKLAKGFSEETGMPLMDSDVTKEGVSINIDTYKIHIWW